MNSLMIRWNRKIEAVKSPIDTFNWHFYVLTIWLQYVLGMGMGMRRMETRVSTIYEHAELENLTRHTNARRQIANSPKQIKTI